MSLVFKTPKSALNTTTGTLQNLKSGDCPAPSLTTESVEYTENGEYSVTTPQGYDGLSGVSVTVNIDTEAIADEAYAEGEADQKAKLTSLSVSSNGTYNREDGYNAVTVNVPTANLQNKSATSNTLYTQITPSAGYDGMSSATISTSASSKGTASNPYNGIMDQDDSPNTLSGLYYRIDTTNANVEYSSAYGYWEIDAATLYGVANLYIYPPTGGWPTGFTMTAGDVIVASIRTVGGVEGMGEFSFDIYSYNGSTNPSDWIPVVINNQNKTVNPSTSSQSVTADQGYSGLGTVTVNAVTSSIDANIQANNIKNGVSILGVSGTYDPQPNLQSKSATPTTSSQTIQPDSGYDGLSQVTVGAVTSAIDSNIVANNIVDGVTILGVTGTAVEANLDAYSFNPAMIGNYVITPTGGFNGFDEVAVSVIPDPAGSFWIPINVGDNVMMADVYRKYDEGGYFDGMSVFFSMEVETGSIDQDGYYVAEDANGSAFYIHPYIENPDFDPEQPEDPTTNPAYIFPDDFDLSGLVIQVEAPWESVTITENIPADPREETTYTVEIDECNIVGINYNGDSQSWAFGTLEIDQNGVFDPKGFAEIEVNVSGCPDWSSIGWDCNDVNNSALAADIAYTAQKKEAFEGGTISSFANDTKLVFAPMIQINSNIKFSSCTSLRYVPLFDTSSMTNMQSMFSGCQNLTTVPLFDTSNVTNMTGMFSSCNNLESVPLFNTSNVTNMNAMFNSCTKLTSIPAFDTSNVTTMSGTFQGANSYNKMIIQSYPAFDTSSVTNMSNCFSYNSFTTAPTLNTSNVTNMNTMFSGCTNLTTVPLYNTSKVSSISGMFYGCSSLTTIPQFDFSNVTNVSEAFSSCTNLTTIPILNFEKATGVISLMFSNCTSLTNLGGFVDLGKSFNQASANSTLDLSASSVLTYQSIMNVINNIAAPDNTAINPTLKLSAASYALLSASDIAIATAKNWTVTSA